MALIDYRSIDVRHGQNIVLENVCFSVSEGEFVYLVGRVGSGKTSLLKTLYGELPVYRNTASEKCQAQVMDYDMIKINRSRTQELRRSMGIVFQDFQLLSDRTVGDNLDFVLQATGWKKKADRKQRIYEVLTQVGMAQYQDSMPYQLSGGEQQCVCIARALLNSPRLILADEATGNLDQQTGLHAASLLYDISRQQGTAVIMSTHNEGLMADFPGRIMRCANGHLEVEGSECENEPETEEEQQNTIIQ